MLPEVLVASMELEMVVLVCQEIHGFFIGGSRRAEKRVSGPVHPSRVTFMNLAQDFVRLFLYSDSIEDFFFVNLLLACLFKLSPD